MWFINFIAQIYDNFFISPNILLIIIWVFIYIMKFIILLEELLQELQGVSFDARSWTPVILKYLKSFKNSPKITIDGLKYPEEHKIFPIDQMNIFIDKKYGNGGGYDEQISGYESDGKYHAYFIFGPEADISTVTHELRHAYEDYMRISKGKQPMKQNKEAVNLFGGDFAKFFQEEGTYPEEGHYGSFNGLLIGLYYTSKIERSAYSETVYDNQKYRRSLIDYINNLMKLNDYSYIRTHYSVEMVETWWNALKENYRIPILDKFKDAESFIRWSTDEIQYKGQKTLKKLRNVKYFTQQSKKEGNK
jgi:hypothetical protein